MKIILEYNPDKEILDDITDIHPVIQRKGTPPSITYEARDRKVETNFINGRFCIDGTWIEPVIKGSNFSDLNEGYRPVYFRRVKKGMNLSGNKESEEVKYFLGWQITVDGDNYKYFACIHPDGAVSLGENK